MILYIIRCLIFVLGTVVDTDIVHPQDFDFYLNSHATIQGKIKFKWTKQTFSNDSLLLRNIATNIIPCFIWWNRLFIGWNPIFNLLFMSFRCSLYESCLNTCTCSLCTFGCISITWCWKFWKWSKKYYRRVRFVSFRSFFSFLSKSERVHVCILEILMTMI